MQLSDDPVRSNLGEAACARRGQEEEEEVVVVVVVVVVRRAVRMRGRGAPGQHSRALGTGHWALSTEHCATPALGDGEGSACIKHGGELAKERAAGLLRCDCEPGSRDRQAGDCGRLRATVAAGGRGRDGLAAGTSGSSGPLRLREGKQVFLAVLCARTKRP